MDDWKTPRPVSDVDIVFGGIDGLLPERRECEQGATDQWRDWQRKWFFSGLDRYPAPKDGIDLQQAMRHLSAIQGSFEPKHEHKEAAVAYLAGLWFSSPDGGPIPSRKRA